MRIERKQHHTQRKRGREGALTRGVAHAMPRHQREHYGSQPAQQAQQAGFGQHFQHPLMGMAGALAHTAGFVRHHEVIVGWGETRIGIAVSAHADAIDRMRFEHRHAGTPDIQPSGQGGIQRLLRTAQCVQRAIHAQLEAFRSFPGKATRQQQRHGQPARHGGETQRRSGDAPGESQRHQRVAQPRRARTGHQHRPQQEYERQQHALRAPAALRRPQRERRQHGKTRPKLRIGRAEDAGDALRLGVPSQAPAGEDLSPRIQCPERQHHRDGQVQRLQLVLPADGEAGVEAQRRVTKQRRHGAPALAWRHRIDRGDQRRAHVGRQEPKQEASPRVLA